MNGINATNGIAGLIGGKAEQQEAAGVVAQSMDQLRQMQIAEADATISRQLEHTPDDADVIDAALRIKITRSLYGAAETLADRYQRITGNAHELRDGIEYIKRQHLPEAPAVADAVFAFLRQHVGADKLRCTGAGKINHTPGIILVFDVDEKTANTLTSHMRAAVSHELGCDQVPYGCAGRKHLPPEMREDLNEQIGAVLREIAAMMADDDDDKPAPRVLH